MLAAALLFSCKKGDDRKIDPTYNPVIEAPNFTNPTALTNQYFPFPAGKKYIFEGQTEDGFERIEVQLTNKTKTILGIACAVVNDKVWLDGKLKEDTDDWYAQDNDGNVWYMGEYSTDYNPDGTVLDHDGSWEAGVDGAKPGVQMFANPQVGPSYRQEYYFNEAEDEAEIVETGLSVAIPLGTFTNCIKIKEWTDLEPDHIGFKTYAPGIGLIQDGEINLVKIE